MSLLILSFIPLQMPHRRWDNLIWKIKKRELHWGDVSFNADIKHTTETKLSPAKSRGEKQCCGNESLTAELLLLLECWKVSSAFWRWNVKKMTTLIQIRKARELVFPLRWESTWLHHWSRLKSEVSPTPCCLFFLFIPLLWNLIFPENSKLKPCWDYDGLTRAPSGSDVLWGVETASVRCKHDRDLYLLTIKLQGAEWIPWRRRCRKVMLMVGWQVRRDIHSIGNLKMEGGGLTKQ